MGCDSGPIVTDPSAPQTSQVVEVSLDGAEREIIELRFGFGGEEPMSVQEIADHFGLEEKRVADLIRRVLKRMRGR